MVGKKLQELINELYSFSNEAKQVNLKISSASVGWHISHSLLVIIKISHAIKNSNETDYKVQFSWRKMFLLVRGKFPRGKAQAPSSVKPMEEDIIDFHQLHQEALDASEMLRHLKGRKFFKHPLLGYLSKKETIRFLKIHTVHHLKIMKDILN
jgi:hypothetical protein